MKSLILDENNNIVVESFLLEMLALSISGEDFLSKVNYSITNEKSRVSKQNDINILKWYIKNKEKNVNKTISLIKYLEQHYIIYYYEKSAFTKIKMEETYNALVLAFTICELLTFNEIKEMEAKHE